MSYDLIGHNDYDNRERPHQKLILRICTCNRLALFKKSIPITLHSLALHAHLFRMLSTLRPFGHS
jgi:hypothetical protein